VPRDRPKSYVFVDDSEFRWWILGYPSAYAHGSLPVFDRGQSTRKKSSKKFIFF
jgi:hypothetical protein